MSRYADGFVIPVPAAKLSAYRRMAVVARKVWMEHGALQYVESVLDDSAEECGIPFPTLLKPKKGETVVFAWILFKSRAHRDRVNAKAMADPRLARSMVGKALPFDARRMSYGGFQVMVEG
jgi:uncharacterized protein YbaA (DUF1428 family)